MEKTQNVDVELLDKAIEKSGLKIGYIADALGITRQAFDMKRKGKTAFRKSEIYVICDLLKITDDNQKTQIFFPEC